MRSGSEVDPTGDDKLDHAGVPDLFTQYPQHQWSVFTVGYSHSDSLTMSPDRHPTLTVATGAGSESVRTTNYRGTLGLQTHFNLNTAAPVINRSDCNGVDDIAREWWGHCGEESVD